MGRLAGKTAIITGAGSGIGKAISLLFAREGARVCLTGRTQAKLAAVAGEIESLGGNAEIFTGDMADEPTVERLFAFVSERFSRLDLLVNNAGAFEGGPIEELSSGTWDRVLATNLRAPFLCLRGAFRLMKPQGGGRIINIGSIAAKRVRVHSAPYAASKHGLWGLTQAAALEGREFGITVGCIHPGNTEVERRTESGKLEDDEPMLDVSVIAETALFVASMPPEAEMLETVVLPCRQAYVGRG